MGSSGPSYLDVLTARYVRGDLELDEFERLVEETLAKTDGGRYPCNPADAALKELFRGPIRDWVN